MSNVGYRLSIYSCDGIDTSDLKLTDKDEDDCSSSDDSLSRCITFNKVWVTRMVFFLFFMGDLVFGTYNTHYVTYKTALGLNISSTSIMERLRHMCLNSYPKPPDEQSSEWELVHKHSLSLLTNLNVIGFIPMMVSVLTLGFWSDISCKRKTLLWIPILGNIVYSLAMIGDCYLQAESNILLYIGALASGIGGGNLMFISGANTILCAQSSETERIKELAKVQICLSLAVGMSHLMVGLIVYWSIFPNPAWISFTVSVMAFLGCIFIDEPQCSRNPTFTDYILKIHRLLIVFTDNVRLFYILWMYLLALGVYGFIYLGSDRTSMLIFDVVPLCMDIIWISWWMFTQGIAMFLGMYFLSTYGPVYLNDTGMIYTGFLSCAAGAFCLIMASNHFTVFCGESSTCFFINILLLLFFFFYKFLCI